MSLHHLLLSGCLLPGKNTFEEKGVRIKVSADNNETVLFFCVDEKSNPSCKLRQLLGLNREGMKICDLIIFYANNENQRTVCFVELKGGRGLKDAKEQVINTYTSFRDYLQESNLPNQLKAKAYIKIDGAVPLETEQYKQELTKVFGKGNYDISQEEDISPFLRGLISLPQGKKNKNKNR
jgi:hypothetical protein